MFASRLGCARALLLCMHHRMARRGRNRKLRNQVERIARRNRAHREVSINRQNLFAGTGSMAAQAILILIHGRRQHAGSVARADACNVLLRDADQRRRGKYANRFGSMRVVAVHAGRMAIVVQQDVLGRSRADWSKLGNGCPTLGAAYSANTLAYGAIGETFVPPLWQEMQSCSFCPRSNRVGPLALCGAWHEMHASGSHRGIAPEQGLRRDLAGGKSVRAGGPIGQRIRPGRPSCRVGSWQARQSCPFELSFTRKFSDIGSLACTCGLWHDVHSTLPLISFTASGRVGGRSIRGQRGNQVDIVLQGQRKAEWVRRLHVAAEHISCEHRSARRHLAICHGSSHRHGAVMAAKTLIADGAEHRLRARCSSRCCCRRSCRSAW